MPTMKGCPGCGKTIAIDVIECPHCHQQNDGGNQPRVGSHFCTQCGTVATPRHYTKGSFIVEVFLYLLMILPGILYTLWRLTSKYSGCPACGAANMVPITSPVAQAALKVRA